MDKLTKYYFNIRNNLFCITEDLNMKKMCISEKNNLLQRNF